MVYVRYSFIILIILVGTCWAGVTMEYRWAEVDQPFQQTIKIPLYGKASLDVNIPAKYLQKKYLTFRMVIDTPFRVAGDTMETTGFSLFAPDISVNGSRFSGVYSIRFKYIDGENRSNAYVKIKTKHFKPGDNNLSFNAGRDLDIQFDCGGESQNCVALYVQRLWLER